MSRPISVDHGFRKMPSVVLELEEIIVSAWCSDENAELPPEQVHMAFKLIGLPFPLVARFKSPETLVELIVQLERYRKDVWPNS